MPLPIKAHYATVAMLALALRQDPSQPVSLREIADEQNIPLPFLTQIVQQLKSVGLVFSSRGSAGGYRLNRPAREIQVAEIVEAVCPRTHSIPEEASRSTSIQRCVGRIWDRADEVMQEYLQELSLQELVEQNMAQTEAMFYI